MRNVAAVTFLLLSNAFAFAQPHRGPEPTGPTAVFDTTMGRISCRLYAKQAPKTVANFIALAQGTKDWHDHLNLSVVHNTPFYDGTAIAGIADGIRGGDRYGGGEGAANDPIEEEKIPGVTFDRPGRLAMATRLGEVSSSFYLITLHADDEFDKGHRGAIFGQCDDAGVAVAAQISHAMMIVGNRTDKAIAINKLTIVQPGQPMPPVAPDVDPKKIVPQPVPPALETLPSPDPKGPTAVIDTTMGTLTCKLFTEQAPIATATFMELAEGKRPWTNPTTHITTTKPFYNGLHFNRVIPDFMVQQQDYPGGAEDAGFAYGIEPVPGLTFDRPGRLAMANDGPEKNDSSFFVMDAPAHTLDNKFTVFGQCDDATVELVHRMARVPRTGHNRPITPVMIKSVTIQR
ncbi:peptidylprolyl isomerase [Terriglobus roseus]|uniref:peptidylprolyl isomerase n=1 Tax=Terriglobus roseus TaxID=392734 RepID=A0A1H4MMT6_9BACT|nr:peptidylprolyl isomerase [Terriglobus roseus]SEB84346.1 peptidyl-prolyl cis-trans isomerase A (cyclophilin A) [Terriglobus roseus]